MQHRIGLYLRVSTDEQALRADGSLENQKHRLLAEVKRKNEEEPGWGKVVETYTDDGFSAKDTNRPAYQRMMKDIRAGRIDLILVAEFSRMSRNMLDFCKAMEELKRVGASILSIKEKFDTSTSVGHMMVMNMVNLAQFEREQVAERVTLNFHARALRGLRNGGQPILGYDPVEKNPGILQVNAKEAEDVRAIFQMFLEEESVARTAKRLNQSPIRPKALKRDNCRHNQKGFWQSRTVLNLLRNPSYIGIREINAANKDKDQRRLKPHDQYTQVKASWPGIVDEKTFNEVQRVLDENLKANRARLDAAEERIFLLSGVLDCGECGRALVGCSGHGAKNVHRYYVHRPIEGEKVECSIKTIRAEDIEQKILEHLDVRLTSDGYLQQLGERVVEMKKAESKDESSELERRERELTQVNRDIDAAFRMLATEGASDSLLDVSRQKLEEYTATKKRLEARIADLKWQIADGLSATKEMELVAQSLEDFKRLRKKGNRKGLKRLIRKVFAAIKVERHRLGLFYWTASEAAIVGFEAETKKATGGMPVASNSENAGRLLPFREPAVASSRDEEFENLQFRKIGRGGGI